MLYNKRPLIYIPSHKGSKKTEYVEKIVPEPVYISSIAPVAWTQYLNYGPGSELYPQRFFLKPEARVPAFSLPYGSQRKVYNLVTGWKDMKNLDIIPIYHSNTGGTYIKGTLSQRATSMRWLPLTATNYQRHNTSQADWVPGLVALYTIWSCFYITSAQKTIYRFIDTSRTVQDQLNIQVEGETGNTKFNLMHFSVTTAIGQIQSRLSSEGILGTTGCLFCSSLGWKDTPYIAGNVTQFWDDNSIISYANDFLNKLFGKKTAVEVIDLNN